MKANTLFGLFLLTGMQLVAAPIPNEMIPTGIIEAAKTCLPTVRAEGAQMTMYGSSSNLSTLRLGQPVPVFRLSPQRVESYQPGEGLAKFIEQPTSWMVPVENLGTNIAFIQVRQADHRRKVGYGWDPAGYGFYGLAQQWEQVHATWDKRQKYSPVFVRIEGEPDWYVAYPENPRPVLTTIADLACGRETSAEETFKALRGPRKDRTSPSGSPNSHESR